MLLLGFVVVFVISFCYCILLLFFNCCLVVVFSCWFCYHLLLFMFCYCFCHCFLLLFFEVVYFVVFVMFVIVFCYFVCFMLLIFCFQNCRENVCALKVTFQDVGTIEHLDGKDVLEIWMYEQSIERVWLWTTSNHTHHTGDLTHSWRSWHASIVRGAWILGSMAASFCSPGLLIWKISSTSSIVSACRRVCWFFFSS